MIDREYPEDRDRVLNGLLLDLLKDCKRSKITILDAGCGHASRIHIPDNSTFAPRVITAFADSKREMQPYYFEG